jgi:hypothetical protein
MGISKLLLENMSSLGHNATGKNFSEELKFISISLSYNMAIVSYLLISLEYFKSLGLSSTYLRKSTAKSFSKLGGLTICIK